MRKTKLKHFRLGSKHHLVGEERRNFSQIIHYLGKREILSSNGQFIAPFTFEYLENANFWLAFEYLENANFC